MFQVVGLTSKKQVVDFFFSTMLEVNLIILLLYSILVNIYTSIGPLLFGLSQFT